MVNVSRLVAPPVFADEDKTRVAQILNFCLWVVLVGAGLFAVATPILMPERISRLPISLSTVFLALLMLGLLRSGYVRTTSLLFTTILWLLFSYAAITSGGIQQPGFSLQFLVIVIATLTLGGRTALGFALLSGLFGVGMYLAQESGTLPAPLVGFPPTSSIITQLVSMGAIALLMYRADQSINEALTRYRQSERALAERNRQLESEIAERKRVEEALLESQSRLTDAHVIANIGTWESDLLTGEESWSDETFRQLGFEPGQAPPRFELFFSRVHPEDRHVVNRVADPSLIATGTTHVQYRVIHPNGEIRYLTSRSGVKYDTTGRPVHLVGLTQDITAQKQAEIALQDREEQLRLATDAAHIGVWDWDVKADVAIWSDQSYRIFGLEPGAIMGSSKDFESRVYPPDLPLVKDTLGRADAHGHLNLGDYRIIHADGSLRWIYEQSKVYYDAAGQPVRVIGVVQDITARKQVEIELQDREEQLRLATDAAHIGIWDWDIATNVVTWSDHTYRIFGLSRAEFGESGTDFHSRVYAEDLPIIQNMLQYADAEGQINIGDFRIIHADDGSLRWVYEQAKVYYDAARQPLRVIGVIQDITERKQAEHNLREQTEILQAIFDNVPLMIAVFDTKWNFKLVNRAWEQVIGWKLEELQNDPHILQSLYPDAEKMEQTNKFVVEAAAKWGDFVTEVRDGRALDTAWANIRLSNDMLIAIGQDITERKQAEKQRLELAVERERVGLLKDFIGNMSHDLKTPLTVLNTSLYLLERLNDPLNQQARIAGMKQQVLLLERLIQDILTMSRLDHTPDITLEPIKLNDLLYDVEHKLHPAAELKRLILTMEFDTHNPSVLANESELYRVMVNLVENAIKYTHSGGMVTIRTRQEAAQAVIEVVDSGIGIGADEMPHIFDRFYRADQARSAETPGTGLGLAIVKRIVEMHNGLLNVDSTLGVGSVFRVSLPLAN